MLTRVSLVAESRTAQNTVWDNDLKPRIVSPYHSARQMRGVKCCPVEKTQGLMLRTFRRLAASFPQTVKNQVLKNGGTTFPYLLEDIGVKVHYIGALGQGQLYGSPELPIVKLSNFVK